jgi:tRNA(fMet)-specific endonuclease VapC
VITVLDTTAFAAAMRNEPGMVSFLRARRPGATATVPPVVAEIEYGIRRMEAGSRRRRALERERDRLLSVVGVLPWLPDASARFGEIKAVLESSGQLIEDLDIAIAAIAMSHGAQVLTANLPHFSRITGLASLHWDAQG